MFYNFNLQVRFAFFTLFFVVVGFEGYVLSSP